MSVVGAGVGPALHPVESALVEALGWGIELEEYLALLEAGVTHRQVGEARQAGIWESGGEVEYLAGLRDGLSHGELLDLVGAQHGWGEVGLHEPLADYRELRELGATHVECLSALELLPLSDYLFLRRVPQITHARAMAARRAHANLYLYGAAFMEVTRMTQAQALEVAGAPCDFGTYRELRWEGLPHDEALERARTAFCTAAYG